MAVRDAGVPLDRVRLSGYFFFRLDLSVTVVRGFRFAVVLETNRPLMALLARVMRLPPVLFFADIFPPSLAPPLMGHGSSVPTPGAPHACSRRVTRCSC